MLGVIITSIVGIMTMSFKAKESTGNNELMSSKAVFILGELKKNILDAQVGQITCPDSTIGVGNSISFATKSGGTTTLLCDSNLGEIASASANGTYNYLSDKSVTVKNCQDFVWCNLSSDSEILSVGFSLNLSVGGSSGIGTTGIFYGEVTPRN